MSNYNNDRLIELEAKLAAAEERLAEARALVEYAYDELGGAWPAALKFLHDSRNRGSKA